MDSFPLELLHLVIDELANSFPREQWLRFTKSPNDDRISNYSTVSRRWVERTQHHHFKWVFFMHRKHLEYWRKVITSGSDGVSRHTVTLTLIRIVTLDGFDGVLGAFTNVKCVELKSSNIFSSLNGSQPLISLKSNLVALEIHNAKGPSEVFAGFSFPHLRQFGAHWVTTAPRNTDEPLPSIPFFELEGAKEPRRFSPEVFKWMPRTARFKELTVGAL